MIAAILNPKRKCYELILSASTKQNLYNEHKLSDGMIGCAVKTVDAKEIDKIIGLREVSHQGVAMRVAPLEYHNIKDLLEQIADKKSVIIALDNVTDPQNVGAIVRSAVAFGAHGVLIPKFNSSIESGALVKAAVGNFEKIPICVESNLNSAFRILKDHGYWIFGLVGGATENISLIKKYDKVVLVLGSEGEGMRKLVKENCDVLIKIPIQNTDSLNVSNAAAIALYEASINA